MFLPSTDDVDAEIRQLIQGVTDKSTSELARHELVQLADYDMSGCISVLKGCLDQVLSNAEELKKSEFKQALLSAIFRHCLSKTYFGICFYEALMPQTYTDNLLEMMSNVLKLSASEKTGVVLALLAADYVQAVANAYFRLMLSGKMSVNDMIQILSRFKGSQSKREQSIFSRVISKLFEEIKFFPKYPEKELKLVAVLFGCLIKHQLVTSPGLGIVFRVVLDGLRKPADSKMFVFGAIASKQFMDCVTKWPPHYCSIILKISHLREVHIEMVSTTERDLANTLSSPAEPKQDFHIDISQNKSISYDQPKNLKKQVREMTRKYLIQCDSSEIEDHTSKLLEDLRFSECLILEEIQEVSKLKGQQYKHLFSGCQPDLFKEEFGDVMDNLKTLSKANDKTLKDMKNRLYENFNGDDALLNQVKDILERNKAISRKAANLVSGYCKYFERLEIEKSWLNEFPKRAEEVYGLLLEYASMFTELEKKIVKQKIFFGEHFSLNTLVKIWKKIGLLSKEVVSHTNDSKDLCLESKNRRTVLIEKVTYAERFYLTEQRLRTESFNVNKNLVDLCREVKQVEISYKKKMDRLPEASEVPKMYENFKDNATWSWRTRKLNGRNILPAMREQGRDMCAFASTVAMTESLNKRRSANYSLYSGSCYRLDEFIKLSEYHLQDIVTDFYARNKRKGREKLDVCLERMRETGVVSEAAYDKVNMKATGFARYRISDFQQLDPARFKLAFRLLEDATVLIGTFAITKGYFDLKPDDVYDAKNGDVLETSTAGNTLTHAVVIVGYGRSPQGTAYYVFLNWYGPEWGRGGFGRLTCASVRQLYSASLYR